MLNLAKINKEKKDTKTNRVSKYTISVQKLCYSLHEYKGSSKKYYPIITLFMLSKNKSVNLQFPKY